VACTWYDSRCRLLDGTQGNLFVHIYYSIDHEWLTIMIEWSIRHSIGDDVKTDSVILDVRCMVPQNVKIVCVQSMTMNGKCMHGNRLNIDLCLHLISDYNFIRNESGKCVLAGPEKIPPGACTGGETKFMGSSG
jgi:hypothetical protein